MLRATEIFPPLRALPAGCPSCWANSSEIQERPLDVERAGARFVIVLMSFDIEKDEAGFPVAHDQVIIGFARRAFSMTSWLERRVYERGEDRGVFRDEPIEPFEDCARHRRLREW